MARSRPKRKYRKNSDRVISIRGVRHDPPDPRRLSRALLALAAELAAAQVEADAQATREQKPDGGGETSP
ncbi:hypothetical protein FHT40_002416 [Mycolicibacterium sp. BK556]|uniref:hypothetical protein n=1 Tax=unclassified Mycolicibacterium TaxID=2636767 RepID=UPI001611DFFF|nr:MULTISPECIES: hypothetical protein [unclassified Mycolicibacterium]MBB3602755.1 hypothetical protein [Mycolicibacterium sp. BK556]MBB3632948.1 hypothetical protein [Mycolicibacterium sp. BK607]